VWFRACTDRVSGDPFQKDRDHGDHEAETEQPPVRGNPATPARFLCGHRYFCFPGVLELRPCGTVVVVGVVLVWPGAAVVTVVLVRPGAVVLWPRDVVVVVLVRPGAVALCPRVAVMVVVLVCPGAVALCPRC